MRDQIDELRELLGLRDRTIVSAVKLQGMVETTSFGQTQRSFMPSEDVAVVFAGPRGFLAIERREGDSGSIVYTVTLKPSRNGGPDATGA